MHFLCIVVIKKMIMIKTELTHSCTYFFTMLCLWDMIISSKAENIPCESLGILVLPKNSGLLFFHGCVES